MYIIIIDKQLYLKNGSMNFKFHRRLKYVLKENYEKYMGIIIFSYAYL
jgi:hypothetical protein